ncbi:hypothetical protein A0H81_14876 [Grifola frondosa]|uniref:Uncharacterized protein n=1 Tax=Grifola frondosa TaxID=5627 RepID=A0A1C7LK60_GRIFR|nr:hypothetical protein A0H81_14876 [Grifola frondosa]
MRSPLFFTDPASSSHRLRALVRLARASMMVRERVDPFSNLRATCRSADRVLLARKVIPVCSSCFSVIEILLTPFLRVASRTFHYDARRVFRYILAATGSFHPLLRPSHPWAALTARPRSFLKSHDIDPLGEAVSAPSADRPRRSPNLLVCSGTYASGALPVSVSFYTDLVPSRTTFASRTARTFDTRSPLWLKTFIHAWAARSTVSSTMHWVIMRVRILPPRHLSHTIHDALFVVVGCWLVWVRMFPLLPSASVNLLTHQARRIVPRVLCVQLLETIALTVCGFPPLSYARPRPRLRVRLDVGHRYMSALILRGLQHSSHCSLPSSSSLLAGQAFGLLHLVASPRFGS